MNLEQLKREIQGCKKCDLAHGRTNIVFGCGNEKAKLMLIGEGPGRDEDLQGIPFVGAAGQLLNKVLEAAEINREKIYIANIVKCRPPGNRVPNRKEAAACLPWLWRQLEIIRPRIVVLLGSTALKNLIRPDALITKLRGKWMESKSGIKIMPTYHPAALLRDPSKKKLVWEDFKKIRDEYKKIMNEVS
ncbi:MAG: uracil-DNA glycosylase [Desulfotomaculum sp.]|nr:uracil-DNA glycosylase [Desulfotomaculum sp.]MCL0052501.1 uracil-DNA glycosylase [Peptococcaceae bacterium]MCL0072026.1 uracil-DNA glycosylase [Peptococcaceae bacterium]MCL0077858.1 uracil-DNA glycosylase [Peptococcaceae bacterium]